jgi:hypothetical protein
MPIGDDFCTECRRSARSNAAFRGTTLLCKSPVPKMPDPDVAEVRTKEVPEDDVPTEYDQQG